MSGKIHHGPPGSYKTSGAVMDDLPPAVREGRVVITNVRGLSDREAVLRAIKGADPRFDLIHVDTSTSEGLDRMRRWFHWAPKGALLIIDEAQRIWPPKWKPEAFSRFDYPGGVDAAKRDDRPENHEVAFDMHRHFNWDFVLTTPDIKKIRPEIRGVCEGAYKHRNRAMFGLKGSYLEAFHSPENNGTSQADFYSILTRRIKPWVWGVYASTATGEISDTKAGRSLFRDPRILGLGGLLVAIGAYLATQPLPAPIAAAVGVERTEEAEGDASPDRAGARSSVEVVRTARRTAPSGVPGRVVSRRSPPLEGWDFYIAADFKRPHRGWRTYFWVERDGMRSEYKDNDLERLGYGVYRLGHCAYKITYGEREFFVGCRKPNQTETPSVLASDANSEA